MNNRLAVSLALPDTEASLAALNKVAPLVAMAEIRLDLMESFDLARLITQAPCPLIVTCRPQREGGRFDGSETERLRLLAAAMDLGCAYVDIEWDIESSVSSARAVDLFARRRSATRLIVSRHWNDRMPASIGSIYDSLRARGDVVKLVGAAHSVTDILPIIDLLARSADPVIALAMGEAGRLSRLLSPCFASCFLTYCALDDASATAPGQMSISEAVDLYALHKVGPHTNLHIHLCEGDESARAVREMNEPSASGESLHLPLTGSVDQAAELIRGLKAALPRLSVTADPPLEAALSRLAPPEPHRVPAA